jgi:LacI family transcriptional regulator
MNTSHRPKKITRDDVALLAGVSSATVSHVVNHGSHAVSEETRLKVLRAIEELNYRPNAVARNLRLQRTSTLGLIVPDTLNPYFTELARGVESVAFEHGFIVVLCHSQYSPQKEMRYVEVLSAERAAGVIWVPASEDETPAMYLNEMQIPLIVLDRRVEHPGVLSIVADNFRGGYIAAKHLLDYGHTRIGCITRPVGLYHSNERSRGYCQALQAQGLEPCDEWIVRGGYRFEDGYRAARELLSLPQRPTAIFAYNDLMAIGAMRAARELGLDVPEQLSIVGFDDIPGAAYTFPPLTSIRQSKLAMGQRSAQMLIELINGKPWKGKGQITLGVELVIRESSGPAPL